MFAKNLISEVVPALHRSDNGQKALNWMDVFRVSHLPVVDETHYVGLVSDKLIYDLNLVEENLGQHLEKFPTPHIHEGQHIFEVASVMYKLKLSVLPVVDSGHVYLGVIVLYDLARRFAYLYSVHEPGGVITLEMNEQDYFLSQIASLVESNDAKILSLFVSRIHNTNNLLVTIKLNVEELSPVIQTFLRYNYNVSGIYMDNSMLKDLYEDRFDQFMKYMNI